MKNNKLTPETIQRVKDLLKLNMSEREVANYSGVAQSTVHKIKTGCYDTGSYIPVNKVKDDLYDYSWI